MRSLLQAILMTAVLLAVGPAAAAPWFCTLPDTITVPAGAVTVADLSTSPVPAGSGAVVVFPGGQPGSEIVISRRTILRLLVQGQAVGDVRFKGAAETRIAFAGARIPEGTLEDAVKRALTDLVPESMTGAPDSWFEIVSLPPNISVNGNWSLSAMRSAPLNPGRQQVRFKLNDSQGGETIASTVVMHHYGEGARSVRRIGSNEQLRPDLFTWEWIDLADGRKGRVIGRRSLEGTCSSRTLTAGTHLLEQDLKAIPVVRAGDPVELNLARGGVTVAVRAYARQEGCLGQTIPVRNELTGQLVNARVTGPGTVEWRR